MKLLNGFNTVLRRDGDISNSSLGINTSFRNVNSSTGITEFLYPSSNGSGSFNIDSISSDYQTAVTNRDDFISCVLYKRLDNAGTGYLLSFGKESNTEGRIQHYLSNPRLTRSIVRTSTGTNAHFRDWGTVSEEFDYGLFQHRWNGSNYVIRYYNSNGYQGESSDPYTAAQVDTGMNTGRLGGLRRNGAEEYGFQILIGAFIAFGSAPSAGVLTTVNTEFSSGTIEARLDGVLSALEGEYLSDTVLSTSLAQGVSARVGTRPEEVGTLTYETVTI